MTATSTAKKSLVYANDGTGRDTFVNYAGAYWMNPLPAGTFFQSAADASSGATTQRGSTVTMGDNSAHPGRTLFGQSRYGTTVLAAGQAGLADGDPSASGTGAMDETRNTTAARAVGDGADGFDAEATALDHVPYDVSQPEQRLRQPGHSTVGLDGTNGGSTYNGVKGEWAAPNAVDNTLLRMAPTYESTCHHHLRTGRFFSDDAAPAPQATLPDKGVTWGKSRYY